MNRPKTIYAYRIIQIDSLASVLKHGTYASRHVPPEVAKEGGYRFIADRDLTSRRDDTEVRLVDSGTLGDYVPFYFGKRGPLLYRLHHGHGVEKVPQGSLIYVVYRVEHLIATSTKFCYTDAHASSALAQFYDDPAHLDQLDWVAINKLWWKNTTAEPHLRARKQAEFLLWRHCPSDLIAGIVTLNEEAEHEVQQIVSNLSCQIGSLVAPDNTWYY